jgi:hypothetical protein
MNAGDLREQITIKRLDTASSAWVTLDNEPTVRAAIESQGAEGYRVRIRHRYDIFGFKDTHPALMVTWHRGPRYEDRDLDVTDVIETDRGREVTLIASSRQIETLNLQQGARRTQAWLRTQI